MIRGLIRAVHALEDSLLIASLVTMLGLALLQIFMRNFLDDGFLWAESFLRILVLWVAMLGAMVATRANDHIKIDVLARYVPTGVTRYFSALTCLFAAGVCGLVAWHSIELVRFEYEDQTIAFAFVPVWVCQAILPVGFGVMALRFVAYAIRQLLGWDNGESA